MSHKKAYFDEKAAKWDTLIEDEVILRLKNMVEELALPPGCKVLDLGTGTGVLVPLLIEAVGSAGNVVGLDFAPQMLAEARKKYQYPNLEFIEGAAEEIPLTDQAVDEVVCNSAFPHFDDLRRSAQEMARVLRPGGRVTVMHPHSREYINNLHVSLGGAVQNCLLPEEKEMKSIFAEAGFAEITLEDAPQGYCLSGRKA
ncbi:class I SAM-dependent methyltransferase [Desulfosporosinus meridiei]|uniref:Methylase involved in ubiquinone/menaquinone biosynthesis n=1 Tax=Desulfosporosinus meridiei (strain ATCC BAA-275 / DSM 13257 / KCTC 12902 / NCIMB 13706 / S10) TaxID=768704 RepID=J7ITV2_DESMD|nr:methyltransferase domain-containing protein [Desulfosporosinus meridiei]AFQ42543.1 methylase involved in ubiquinone/menaquinone biosynthesis [Desulfosporosinus meridiei DSM 13257]